MATTITPIVGSSTFAGIASALGVLAIPIITPLNNGASWLVQWLGMTAGSIGAAIIGRRYNTASLQAEGVFGSGGSIQLEGSNDNSNFHKLTASALTGAGISATAAADGAPCALRVNCTAGDSTTSLTATMWLQG